MKLIRFLFICWMTTQSYQGYAAAVAAEDPVKASWARLSQDLALAKELLTEHKPVIALNIMKFTVAHKVHEANIFSSLEAMINRPVTCINQLIAYVNKKDRRVLAEVPYFMNEVFANYIELYHRHIQNKSSVGSGYQEFIKQLDVIVTGLYKNMEDVFYLILPDTHPVYREDLMKVNPRYVGTFTQNPVEKPGGYKDPGVESSIKHDDDSMTIVSPVGQEVTLPKGLRMLEGPSDLVFMFPRSCLNICLFCLPRGDKNHFKRTYESWNKAGAEEEEVEPTFDVLVPSQKGKSIPKGRKKTSSSKGGAAGAAAAGKDAVPEELGAIESVAAGGAGAAAVDEEASTAAAAKTSSEFAYVPADLKAIILRLAAAQINRPELPLEALTVASKRQLKEDANSIAMLANLLGVNAGQYGEPKSPDAYNWSELVHLLGQIGWSAKGSGKSGYFEDGDGKVFDIHYPHNIAGHKLYPALIGIMFSKLECKGYNQAYLRGLLPGVPPAAAKT